MISEVDVYTVWPDALTGDTAGTPEVKSTPVAGLEFRAGHRGADGLGTAAGNRDRVVLTCAACDQPVGIARADRAPETTVCASCVAAAGMVDLFAEPDLDDPLAPDPAAPGALDEYADAQRDEKPWHLDVDGEPRPGEYPPRRRH